MKATVDAGGRIMLPKPLREALDLTPGTKVDISLHGPGLTLVPERRSAKLVRDADGRLVAQSATIVTDSMVYSLVDANRK